MINDSILYLPENIRDYEIYPKITEMIDKIITDVNIEFSDVKNKWKSPGDLNEDTVKEIILESGYDYINSIIDTLSGVNFNILVYFLGMISLMKGHRSGLEAILRLLGMDSVLREWWEVDPQGTPDTFDMVVFLDTSTATDVFETLEKVKEFTKHYVYPIFETVEMKFSLAMATANCNMAGFYDQNYLGTITGTV